MAKQDPPQYHKPPPWFRFYNEIWSDRKIKRIRTRTGQPKFAIIGLWSCLMTLASESPDRGKLIYGDDCLPVEFEDIVDESGMEPDQCKSLIDQFVKLGMLHLEGDIYVLTNWDKRQFKSDHDSAERSRRSRQRKNAERGAREVVEELEEVRTEQWNNSEDVSEGDSNDGYAKRSRDVVATLQSQRATVPESESDTESITTNVVSETLSKSEKIPKEDETEKETEKNKSSPLEPSTPGTIWLFEQINKNRAAKGFRRGIYFKSLEQKKKCEGAETRLGKKCFYQAVSLGLEQGLVDLKSLTNYIAKYDPGRNGAHNGPGPTHTGKQRAFSKAGKDQRPPLRAEKPSGISLTGES